MSNFCEILLSDNFRCLVAPKWAKHATRKWKNKRGKLSSLNNWQAGGIVVGHKELRVPWVCCHGFLLIYKSFLHRKWSESGSLNACKLVSIKVHHLNGQKIERERWRKKRCVALGGGKFWIYCGPPLCAISIIWGQWERDQERGSPTLSGAIAGVLSKGSLP